MNRLAILGSVTAATLVFASACGGDSNSGGDCEANMLAGDLVITEIMANPSGADEGSEYFEIFNATTAPITLTGLALVSSRDDGTDEDVHTMREATIAAGQYFVIGGILDEFKEAYMDYGAANDLSFRNSNGQLALRCKDVEVDKTTYASAPDGASLELNGAEMPNSVRNDDEANFCASATEFAPDFFGSPQLANSACGNVVPGMCDDNGTMRATVPPVLGDVVITEIMPNPGTGVDGEWIEVIATADFDANGLSMARADGTGSASTVSSSACIAMTVGDHLLFSANDDAATNGGLPTADATFTFALPNGGGSVQTSIGETILDVITYDGSTAGVSTNLDAGSNDPVANDDVANFCGAVTMYGDIGNRGTPRATNTACVVAGQCLDNGTPRAIVSPGAGEVAITEWHPNPSGTESAQEFLEVQFSVAADLNGLQFGRDVALIGVEGDSVDAAACIPVAAGGFAVIAANADTGVNGGIPQVDFDYTCTPTSSCTMVNSNGTFFVGVGGTVLDTIAWVATANGVSVQIDGGANQCNTPAGNTYGDGDLGTPGAANATCP